MIDDFSIKADSVNFQDGPRPDLIRVVFRSDAGETKTVDMAKETIPAVAAALLREGGHSTTATESTPVSLSTGMDYRHTGFSLRHLDDGGLEVTMHVELLKEGRKADLQILMPPSAVDDLRRELNSRGQGTVP